MIMNVMFIIILTFVRPASIVALLLNMIIICNNI